MAAQQKITINNTEIWQPDEDLAWDFETTYTPDSNRTQDGMGHFTEMFTTQSFGYKASNVPVAEWAKISQMIIGKKFDLYCFNPHFGTWMSHRCYVGRGSLSIKTLQKDTETFSSISFNAVDVKPLEVYGE